MLVIDLHTLQAVDLLHFVDEILREFLLALDLEDVMGVRRTVHQRLTGTHSIAFVDAHVLALRNQKFLGFALVRRHDHTALAAGVGTERHDAVDLRDYGAFLRLSRFEELGHTGQTARNVLRLRGLSRNFCDYLAGRNFLALGHREIGAYRQKRRSFRVALMLEDRNLRSQRSVFGFDNDLRRDAGEIIHLLLHRATFDDVVELNASTHLRKNRACKGIPVEQHFAYANRSAFLDLKRRAVNNRMTFLLSATGIHDADFTVSSHDGLSAFIVDNGSNVMQLNHALTRGFRV